VGTVETGQVVLTLVAAEPMFNEDNVFPSPVITITPSVADLSIALTAPATVFEDSALTLILQGRNAGPDRVESVVADLRSTLPLAYQSFTTNVGNCGQSPSGEASCTIGTLAAGGTFAVTIQAVAVEQGDYGLRAVVSGNTFDQEPGDNTHDVALQVLPRSPPPARSGGGGSADLLLLIGLGCALVSIPCGRTKTYRSPHCVPASTNFCARRLLTISAV
jgi:hypothetical protein